MGVTATSTSRGRRGQSDLPDAERILDVVADLLGDGGYDALQLREVARCARVSLNTIYKRFPSKDELVLASVERWMEQRVYAQLPSTALDAPIAERLSRWYRQLLTPWEQNPTMLGVFLRARMLPGGERLLRQGEQAVGPSSQHMFDGYAEDFASDVNLILTNVVFGLLTQFAQGQTDMPGMINAVERTIQRVTAGAEPVPS